MMRKARLWTGVTLLLVLLFNYAILGVPLIKKSISLKEKYRATLIRQVKSGEVFKGSDDEYILEIFRKEKAVVDRNMLILNSLAVSLVILIASWMIFGIVMHRGK